MIFAVFRMVGVVKVEISVAVVGGVDQKEIAFQVPHKTDGVSGNILKADLVAHLSR
jgi:hypothetical protein